LGKRHFEQTAWPQFVRNHVRPEASSGISIVVMLTCRSYGKKHFVQYTSSWAWNVGSPVSVVVIRNLSLVAAGGGDH
jgi:hypothetical protein